ncbi:MAG TPA: type II secretion system F family protein [Pedomonas sp.]|nr:type II secretion system F family protein [Pedomonas sp.]
MSPQMTLLLLVCSLLVLALLALAFVLAPNPQKKAATRLEKIKTRFANSRDAMGKAQMRRILAMQDETRLDQLFRGFIPRPAELRARLNRTGKAISLGQYGAICGGIVLACTLAGLVFGLPLLLSFLLGLLLGLGVPHVAVGVLIGKRINQFIALFPDAIDLMVRSLRSGLPITEALAITGKEIADPVGVEFRTVSDKIKIGQTMDQALNDIAKRIPAPEFQFFVITLAIQRETGGNLAETLSNLSEVLRKRQQMKLKIKAMSSEAKASAYIVGALPFIVFALIWMVNGDYLRGFFSDPRLMVAGTGGLMWMSIGGFIMYKMVNFKV